MIRSITIRGYRSFSPHVATTIEFDSTKRIALFYGLNGAGKSAIGQVIHGSDPANDAIDGCAVVCSPPEARYHYLVYNEDFVERNFRNRADMPGIFTLGSAEADVLGDEEDLDDKLTIWRNQLVDLGKKESLRQQEAERALESAVNGVWKSFTTLKNGPFKRWLPYGNSKQNFFEALRNNPHRSSDSPLPTFESLAKALEDLGDQTTAPKALITTSVADFATTETNPLWKDPIIGSRDSALASLIQDLGNIDWVNQGRSFLKHNKQHCPFCQQKLPHDFATQLGKLFDDSYERRITTLTMLADSYQGSIASTDGAVQELLGSEPFANDDDKLALAWANAKLVLKANLERMRLKISAPQQVIEIKQSARLLDEVKAILVAISRRVQIYNQRLSQRDTELQKIQYDFWRRLGADNRAVLDLYDTTSSAINEAIEDIKNSRVKINDEISAAERKLAALNASTTGTEKAVGAINARLASLGMESFKIAKHDNGNFYHLVRPGKGVDDYASLSEGEKTLITFFYFVELINGSDSANKLIPLERKIVVIDDPISSLSHNYVYDIAATISRDVMALTNEKGRQLKQVIVLTHSLFFLNELMKVHKKPGSIELRRVIKKEFTSVVPLEPRDLKNDYEAWWQVIRDALDDRVGCATLANAMRCILERFFYFIKKEEKWKDALKELEHEDRRFIALSRYLDHHSHADGTTITDFGEYDIAYCLAKFEAVFEKTGHSEHFQAMLRQEAPTPA